MDRKELIEKAKETLAVSQSGTYRIGNWLYKLPPVHPSKFYPNVHPAYNSPVFPDTELALTPENTVDAIFRLEKNPNTGQLGVLNFASAHHPGGGFLKGAMAQEECLAQCSNLYLQQTTGDGPLFYEQNAGGIPGVYTDGMLASEVVFFKDGKFDFVKKPAKCLVVTSPAVNVPAAGRQRVSQEIIQETMLNRMRKVLQLFITYGCDTIILGAFGCGVFGNDTGIVAENWKQLLEQEEMNQHFRHICFAVMGKNSPNFKAFQAVYE